MKQGLYQIERNRQIAKDIYKLILSGDTSEIKAPGQFVNIKLDGLFLRRPISVCDREEGSMTLIYKVVGKGTARLKHMQPGEMLDLLCPLGNGFDASAAKGKKVLLCGGGVGVPPLYALAKQLRASGEAVTACLGFNDKQSVFLEEQFRKLGCDTRVATMDGSYRDKGPVTAHLPEYEYYFACGPQAMLKALHRLGAQGQLSFEERMGCGFGACMGCTCKTITGYKRICVDGPVLASEEVSFDEQA